MESKKYLHSRTTVFQELTAEIPALKDILGAKVLAWLPDSTTTDHISPAGAISADFSCW